MPLWSMDDWQYVERQVVADPKGRLWSVALMDVLGQAGDPEVPNKLLEFQYASGRYFTLIYSSSGALQWERSHASLSEAIEHLSPAALADGHGWPPRPGTTRCSGRNLDD